VKKVFFIDNDKLHFLQHMRGSNVDAVDQNSTQNVDPIESEEVQEIISQQNI
jgi:hypothetical protein